MNELTNYLNEISKLFGYEYNDSFFEYLKSISKPNNQICNKIIHRNGWECNDCQLYPYSLICTECFTRDMNKHKNHKNKIIRESYYSFCNCGDPNYIKKEGFCSIHKGPIKDEKILMDYFKSSLHVELTELNKILNKIFLLFINKITQYYECNDSKEIISDELKDMIQCFYGLCVKIYNNNYGFLILIILKFVENFPFETNHKCFKYNEQEKSITVIKENLIEKHTCICPFLQIFIYTLFIKKATLLKTEFLFVLFIHNEKTKLITGITLLNFLSKINLAYNFVLEKGIANKLFTNDLSLVISDNKNFYFFLDCLTEFHNTIKKIINLKQYGKIKNTIFNLFNLLLYLPKSQTIDRFSSNLAFFKHMINIIILFDNLNTFENKKHNKFQINSYNPNLIDSEIDCLKITIFLSIILDYSKEENIKYIFELLITALFDLKKKKDTLKNKMFSPHIILIRIYTIFLNRFCFYYSLVNNYDLFDSFQYFQNLFPKSKELNEFLFNELINEFGFIIAQKYSFFGEEMKEYYKQYFNTNISILCDITLMKYILSLSEMKNKFNILEILKNSKIDTIMDFFLNNLIKYKENDLEEKNDELFNKIYQEKKNLEFISSYFQFLLQIIRNDTSMIYLCFQFYDMIIMEFKDKIIDKFIEKEKMQFEKIIENEIIHFILGNNNLITQEKIIEKYQCYKHIFNINNLDDILKYICYGNFYNPNQSKQFSLNESVFQYCDLDYIIDYKQKENAFNYIKNFKSYNFLNTYFSTCLSIQNKLNNNIFDNFYNKSNLENFVNIFKIFMTNKNYLELNNIFLFTFSKIICVYFKFYKDNGDENFKSILIEVINNNKLENTNFIYYINYIKTILINDNSLKDETNKLSKIFKNGIKEVLNFIPKERISKIIKENKYLYKQLNVLTDKKRNYYEKIIKNYEFNYVNEYLNKFQNDFKTIIEEDKIEDFLFYGLSKKNNFYLKLSDIYFNKLINNFYFDNNLSIEIEDIEKISLIKNNNLIEKAVRIFEEIFISNSTDKKMNKKQILQFMNKGFNKNINEYEIISNLFLCYLSKEQFLEFDGFYKFYYDIIFEDENKLKELKNILFEDNFIKEKIKGIDIFWNHLYNLGYNNILEKKEYNLKIFHSNDFKDNDYIKNLLELSNIKITKFSLLSLFVDKKIIEYLNEKKLFDNIEKIKISIPHYNKFIKLNIKLTKLKVLTFYINKISNNINEINNIFPNIISLTLYIYCNIDLFNLFKTLKNSKIENLTIIFLLFEEYIYLYQKNEIYLDNIKNLRIEIDKEYCFTNELLKELFNHIKFPNLESYILSFNIYKFKNMKRIKKEKKIDYNLINSFIIDLLIFKYQFSLISFFHLSNQLEKINFIHLHLEIFDFIYRSKNNEKHLFKFNIINENEFKKYYSSYVLFIDNEEIMKYKKIDIKGLNKINNNLDEVEEIIENDGADITDINLSIGLKKYYINSFQKIRSIYCENEIEKTNLKKLINNKELIKLKYINITIGNIKELFEDIYLSEKYKFLFELFKTSKKLKSIDLRLSSNNFVKNVFFLLFLIKDKQLRNLNISQYLSNSKIEINFEKLIKQYPQIKDKIYYFDEIKINNIGFESKKINNIFGKNKKLINIIICFHNINDINIPIRILNKNKNNNSKQCKLYLNDIKEQFCFQYQFKEFPKKCEIKIKYKNFLTDMNSIFSNCSSLTSLNLSYFNSNNVIDMSYMLYKCSSLTSLNLSNFNTNNVTDMSYMFYGCSSLTSLDLSNFNTNNVINMTCMFCNCLSLTSLDLSSFNTNKVKNMSSMFSDCSKLISLNLSNFNTNFVINMNSMFFNCSSLTSLNLSNFNTNKVIDMSYMFYKCSTLSSLNLSYFNTHKVINMNNMFSDCSSLSFLNLTNFNNNNIYYMYYIFFNCNSLTSLNLSNFNTNNINNMCNMFNGCSSLISLNLSNFNTNYVTNMSYMFYKCSSLTSLNLSNFNTNNVTDMNSMFYKCLSLSSLDLSNFNTNNVIDMSYMFLNCSSLLSLNLSNFNTNNVIDMSFMFSNCLALTSLNLINFNTNNVTDMSYMFYELNKNCNIICNDKNILNKLL